MLDEVRVGVNMSLHSHQNTTVSSDLSLDKEQRSETSALPITNTAATPNACFLGLPLEIREQIYSYLIDHYPKNHGSVMNPSPAGNIISRRNSFHSAILSTNRQIKEEALYIFYRETVWYIRIPAASIMRPCLYWPFRCWKLLETCHPFFKLMRHIKLDFMMPYMHRDSYMAANRTIAICGIVRGFEYETDVLPRRTAVKQIVKALLHVPALKTVSIEWNDIAGWGDWKEKCLCLLPLKKLPVCCVVESVDLALPPKMDYNLYQSWVLEQERETSQNRGIDRYGLNYQGLEKLGSYLTKITSK